jgi:hypothetical protein
MSTFELEPGESRLVTLEQLLERDFHIPAFQRPYDWEQEQVNALVQDLVDAQSRNTPLFLGMVVVCPDADNEWSIIDGQQRLTTLMLALAARGHRDKVVRAHGGGLAAPWVSPRKADLDFTKALLSHQPLQEKTRSQRLLTEGFRLLAGTGSRFTDQSLLNTEIILYVSPSLAGATRLFERINLRGKDVCQFDLVKNKLIEWAATSESEKTRLVLEDLITRHYDVLYRHLDVGSLAAALDSDKLLKVHWILFSEKRFKSSDNVLEQIEKEMLSTVKEKKSVAQWIERYLQDLVRVTETWVAVERPYEKPLTQHSTGLRDALLDFARLDREGAMQPLIVAGILRWGSYAEKLVRLCEISSFRSALARRNSNQGRSFNWSAANKVYQKTWVDENSRPINSIEAVVNQVFWNVPPHWNSEEAVELGKNLSSGDINAQIFPEAALGSANFYAQYRHLIHYMFFKYGRYLPNSPEWGKYTQEDISPLQDGVWFGSDEEGTSFRAWDIEHLYPQNPDDLDTQAGRDHMKEMSEYLHHLGNLTVLPIKDNRGMKNAAFAGDEGKLEWLLAQRKVSFNELLADSNYRGKLTATPHWGVNNCTKRVLQIQKAAHELWGLPAIRRLGVQDIDSTVRVTATVEQEDDEDTVAA